jgi:HTH-type transcriptional regulator / antitoxin HigA
MTSCMNSARCPLTGSPLRHIHGMATSGTRSIRGPSPAAHDTVWLGMSFPQHFQVGAILRVDPSLKRIVLKARGRASAPRVIRCRTKCTLKECDRSRRNGDRAPAGHTGTATTSPRGALARPRARGCCPFRARLRPVSAPFAFPLYVRGQVTQRRGNGQPNHVVRPAALARIECIFDARPGTPKGDELELLLLLVETFEARACPIDPPDAIAAVRFRMEQQGLKPKDLVPYIGSKSKVSEVLSGRRPLSLAMIRRLVAGLHLPAEAAIAATKPLRARRAKPKPSPPRLPAAGRR